MSLSKPTIEVDVFKELISDMTQQINTNITTTNTNLTALNTKIDTITTRLNLQDEKINDLNQRVEKLEKQSYADVAKSPPKPQTPSNNTGTNTNTGGPMHIVLQTLATKLAKISLKLKTLI